MSHRDIKECTRSNSTLNVLRKLNEDGDWIAFDHSKVELYGQCSCFLTEGTHNCDMECFNCNENQTETGQIGVCDGSRGICRCLAPFTTIEQESYTNWRGIERKRLIESYGLPAMFNDDEEFRIRSMQGKESFTKLYLKTINICWVRPFI